MGVLNAVVTAPETGTGKLQVLAAAAGRIQVQRLAEGRFQHPEHLPADMVGHLFHVVHYVPGAAEDGIIHALENIAVRGSVRLAVGGAESHVDVAAVDGVTVEEFPGNSECVAQGGHLFLQGMGVENGGQRHGKKGNGGLRQPQKRRSPRGIQGEMTAFRSLKRVGDAHPGHEGEIAVHLGRRPPREAFGSSAAVGRHASVAQPDRAGERRDGQPFHGLEGDGHGQGDALGSVGVQGIAFKIAGGGIPRACHDQGGGPVKIIFIAQRVGEPPAGHPAECVLHAAVPEEVFQPLAAVVVNVQHHAVLFRTAVVECREAGGIPLVDIQAAGQAAVDELVAQGSLRIIAEFPGYAQESGSFVGNARAVMVQIILGEPLVFQAAYHGILAVDGIGADGFHRNDMVAARLLEGQPAADVFGGIARSQLGGEHLAAIVIGVQHVQRKLDIGRCHTGKSAQSRTCCNNGFMLHS